MFRGTEIYILNNTSFRRLNLEDYEFLNIDFFFQALDFNLTLL